MREKRLLWLLNHQTLSEFELPLIQDLGFEIFTPKIVPKNILQSSGSITFQYDHTLTIPQEDLDLLNEYDFYSSNKMPLYIKKIINKYFSIAFTYQDSAFLILKKLMYNFEGLIFFRAFGEPKYKNYNELLKFYFSETDFYKMNQLRGRFFFSQCYPNLAEVEEEFNKEAAVYMPLGLPRDFYTVENLWEGKNNKILFFCTRIKYVPDAEKIYNQFKKDFKDFDYVIAGNQPVPVDDPNVTGYLERDELNELYKNCKVMFYHSTNPRHLHYHPLEAMISGMPVVYMNGGLLSTLGGTRQSGSCRNITEAKSKIKRIFEGDQKLISDIKEDQKKILYKFSYEFVLKQWQTNFLPNIKADKIINKSKKISIFLPKELEKAHLNDYFNLATSFYSDIKSLNENHEVEVNIHENDNYLKTENIYLSQKGIALNQYSYKNISDTDVSNTLSLMFERNPMWHSHYQLPIDYTNNYVDSDLWLFILHEFQYPIAPLRPYGIYIEDIAFRIYENISSVYIYNLKMASFILTCSIITKQDLVKHLGIDEKKIYVISVSPSSITLSKESVVLNKDYDVIEIDINRPEKIMDILYQLHDYYSLYRTERKVNLILNNLKEGLENPLVKKMNKFIKKSSSLSKVVSLHFNLREKELNALYAHARMIIYPQHLKNMYYKLSKAFRFTKTIVVEDLKLYRYYEHLMNGQLHYKKFNENTDKLFEILEDISSLESSSLNSLKVVELGITNEASRIWGNII
ncbi:hypothetical protein F4V43_18490 [Paenibacillus spiritus]|uniref:Glycosyltransferase n=1 Tax=Paenibacillus spiritus TaxID=2496557 RepID=A0A5J5FUX5_9BACL|nr:glycosyltransferase [Paenibacillus spiritus]KAA8996587.1 hypothetical protein F4V43_18490 [Paenibacillus spiritus]